jgi:hypothetical protein
MAEDKTAAKAMAEDKAKLEAEGAAREKQRQEHEKNRGRPTPTQDEADLAKLGHPVELSPDGSPPDQNNFNPAAKEVRPAPGGAGYQTRQAAPAAAGRHGTAHTSS